MTDALAEGAAPRRERLHVMVSRRCTNRCVFCLEDDERRARAEFGDPFQILRRFWGRDSVLFTCGEPTLDPSLPDLVRLARDLGYRERELVTNGRLLARGGLAHRLVEAGLTGVTVSIHSHRPEVHDQLTRRRSFLQTLAGLDAVVAAGSGRGLVVRTSTVVVRQNLQDLPDTVQFLCDHGADVVNLNFVEPAGRAARRYGALAPRMSEVAAVVSSLDPAGCRELVVTGLPPCLLGGRARAGIREVIWLWRGGRFVRLAANRGQTHGPPCAACRLRPVCDGVWEAYATRYGWSEFRPVP